MIGLQERILVTGGAGFIGSAVCRHLVGRGHFVVNLDKLTYSSSLDALREIADHQHYRFYQTDICDTRTVRQILASERIGKIMHLAAETHVDRSIDGPELFAQTNVIGTISLLQAALDHLRDLPDDARADFRFHHVSTDEVFGDLSLEDEPFEETTPYAPSSPYAASKAASDHFVRAWGRTYGLRVVLSNCSNNYGPFQFPEKLIPLVILNAIEGKPLPVYGKGANVRDWLHVEDHARALEKVLLEGAVGATYLVGGRSERTNLQVVEAICDRLDECRPRADGSSHRSLITFVADRPGHDMRYAIDPSRIEDELGWQAQESFESGIAGTVDWFLANERWWKPLREQRYGGERLGSAA